MSQILVEEFSAVSQSDVPQLFSSTRDFRFHGRQGKLVHRKLPRGPKGYAVVAVTSTGHEASFVERDRVALTIPLAGRSEVRVAGRTCVTEPGEIFAIGPSERSSNLVPQGEAGAYRSYTIISPCRNAADFLSEGRWLHRPNYRAYLQLKHFIEFAFDVFSDPRDVSARKSALVEALIEDMFVDALKRPPDNRDSDVHRYDGVVHAAQAHMEACLSQPLSTPDIASAVGVGTRTLQIAFQVRHGKTPKQFLSDIRLGAMRSQLACPGPSTTVTSAAMDAGLFHIGRCSYAYRQRYGETPSETLRRAKISTLARNRAKG